MARDDSSQDDESSSYETDSDSSDSEDAVFRYPPHTKSPMKLTTATPASTGKSVVMSDNSSSYDTESDSDASSGEKEKVAPVAPVKSSMKTGSESTTSIPAEPKRVSMKKRESVEGNSTSDESSFGAGGSSDEEYQRPQKLSPEEEAKLERLGKVGYAALIEKRDEIRLDGKVEHISRERVKAEREDRTNTRRLDRESKAYADEMKDIKKRNSDIEKESTHMIKNSRELIRKSSRDTEQLIKMQESIDKDNDELDCASQHWAKDAEDFDKMRKELETEKTKVESDAVTTAKKLAVMQLHANKEKRRQKKEAFRERREREEEEDASKERNEKRVKEEERLKEHGTEKKRTERAYGWYTKLAFPTKDAMRDKVANIKDVDISIDDIDLLPWVASGRCINVAKMNMILFKR